MTVKIDGSNGLLQNYDYQVPTTGFSYTFTTYNVWFAVPAGTLATGTITMPASPVDGMMVTITSTQQITALTINANTGQSIIAGGAVQLNANTSRQYMYRLANTTWYLINVAAGAVVTSVIAGSGISVSAATGAVTISTTGGVTSAVAGNGIAVSAATGAVTFSAACPTFNTVGSYVIGAISNNTASVSGTNYSAGSTGATVQSANLWINCGAMTYSNFNILSGTWKSMGGTPNQGVCLFCRVT